MKLADNFFDAKISGAASEHEAAEFCMADAVNDVSMYGYLRRLTRNSPKSKNKVLQHLKSLVTSRGLISGHKPLPRLPDCSSDEGADDDDCTDVDSVVDAAADASHAVASDVIDLDDEVIDLEGELSNDGEFEFDSLAWIGDRPQYYSHRQPENEPKRWWSRQIHEHRVKVETSPRESLGFPSAVPTAPCLGLTFPLVTAVNLRLQGCCRPLICLLSALFSQKCRPFRQTHLRYRRWKQS